MKIIYKGRQRGKTTELIKFASENNLYIVCPSKREATRIFHYAKKNGLSIVFPITYEQLLQDSYHFGAAKGFVIDDADIMLSIIAKDKLKGFAINKEE